MKYLLIASLVVLTGCSHHDTNNTNEISNLYEINQRASGYTVNREALNEELYNLRTRKDRIAPVKVIVSGKIYKVR